MTNPQKALPENKISAHRVILTSFAVDLLDVLLSFVVAMLSGSIIMIIQVLEGISDLSSSGLLLIGARRSLYKADRGHPFGYGREIYFWTLLSALVMFSITATMSFYFGLQRFLHPTQLRDVTFALIVLLITLFTNAYAFYLSYRRLNKKRKFKHIIRIFYRSSLIETKTTLILDLMGTLASLFGIIALGVYQLTGDLRFDGLGAMVIGIMLGFLSIFLVAGIRDLLVGKSASGETEAKIKKAALSIKEVEEVLNIKTMHVGSEKLLVNIDVHMSRSLTTGELEKLMDTIKAKIRSVVPSVKYIQVELES